MIGQRLVSSTFLWYTDNDQGICFDKTVKESGQAHETVCGTIP